MAPARVALIVDIIGSRRLSARGDAQERVIEVFARAAEGVELVEPLWATAGDEFQALFARIGDAVRVTALMRLLFDDGLDCRFGLGEGESREIGSGRGGPILDGSAWWRAREAIEYVDARDDRAAPYQRTWFVGESVASSSAINAHLLVRDHLVGVMTARARRLAAGSLLGRTQVQLAAAEGVSQSAVSQSLRRSGAAALVAADRALAELDSAPMTGAPA